MEADARFKQLPYQERIHDTLNAVVNDVESATQKEGLGSLIATKWIVLVEVMDSEGEKWITGYRGPTATAMPVWDVKGLLLYSADDLQFIAEPDDEDEQDE